MLYYWPKMFQDIEKHNNFCLRCHQIKEITNKNILLLPLLIPDRPNLQIHANLYSPMITGESNKNVCYASQMLSQNMLYSQPSPTWGRDSCRCHLQSMVLKIWHSDTDSHWLKQIIHQQIVSSTFQIKRYEWHKNVASSSPMQCASGGLQQKNQKVPDVICQ